MRLKVNLFVIIFLLVVGILATGYVKNFAKIRQLREEIQWIQEEIRVMALRNNVLLEEIALLDEDEIIEEIARRELGLVMPGETVYRLADPLPTSE